MATFKNSPTGKDLFLYRKMFNEAAFMGGTHIQYFSVKTKEITDVSSEVYTWEDPICFDAIYDERPKIQFLKRLNWYTEDSEIQPRIIYLPLNVGAKMIIAKRGDKIRVPNPMNGLEDDIFQISEARSDFVPLMWICNLVPFRENVEPEGSESKNNKWLNV